MRIKHRKMKKVIYIFIAIALFGSCTKGYKDLNIDPNQFTTASPETILQGVFKRTNDLVSYNLFREVGHWMNVVSLGGRYDVSDGGLGSPWQTMYVSVLENLQQIFDKYGKDTAFTNRVQIARIWQAYSYSILTGVVGPIPITQANNLHYQSTVLFDTEDSAYIKILTILKDASAKINTTRTWDKLTTDLIYGGDLLKWKKFANTLRLKIALRCTRNLGSAATTAVSEVMADEANTISAEAETAKMAYENISGNENPFWKRVTYGVTDPNNNPKLTDYLLAFFRSYKDPRLTAWYDSVPLANRQLIQDTLPSTADDSLRIVTYPIPYAGIPKFGATLTEWNLPAPAPVGIPNGGNPTFSNISAAIFGTGPSSTVQASRQVVVLGYAEAQFLKAEASILGLGGSKTPDAYYYSGIDANFAYWASYPGISTAAAAALSPAARDAYKATPGIKWGTAGTGFNNYLGIVNTSIPLADINKIWIQAWLSFFPDQSFDFWCLERRTQAIVFPPHTNPGLGFNGRYEDVPLRGPYTALISSLNPVGYADALTKLGAASTSDEVYNPYVPLKICKPFTPVNWATVHAFYDLSYLLKWYGPTIESLRAAAQAAGFANKMTVLSTYHP